MGLLLGDWEKDAEGRNSRAIVRHTKVLMRNDRRKDRVEVSSHQLSEASEDAEKITRDSNVNTRVIGWYHSHPHITVFPSHVDVRTQGQYQMLDEGFLGMIFSCFSNDSSNNAGKIKVAEFDFNTVLILLCARPFRSWPSSPTEMRRRATGRTARSQCSSRAAAAARRRSYRSRCPSWCRCNASCARRRGWRTCARRR